MDNSDHKTLADLEKQASLQDVFFEDAQQSKKSDINIDALHISPDTTSDKRKSIDFAGGDQSIVQEDKELHYRRWFLRLLTITWISIFVAIVVFVVYQYTYRSSIATIESPMIQSYLTNFHVSYKRVLGYLGWAKVYKQQNNLSLITTDAIDQLNTVFDTTLNFIDKKYIIQQAVAGLIQSYTQKNEQLAQVQKDLAQYGFLPQDLVAIFQESDVQISLQRGLVALESIKFSTAINVFSYLDTFVTGFAAYMGVSPEYVREQMSAINERGDQDIYAFLSHCYMNPYELSYDCNIIGDFDVWYAMQPQNTVDPVFLKKLLYYIDQKLEQTELPSFNIVFQRFDPRAETITFSIEVNTFQQDESALVQAGIINPHIYIVTNVIHLLKQNRFIQGSAIDAKQIHIQPKVVRIGSNQFVVNNSLLQYTLPLQKDVAREIYDFDPQ